MAQPRKTAADFGQLSLFADIVPEWLEPAAPSEEAAAVPPYVSANSVIIEDDDLAQFTSWLQQNRHPTGDTR